jgi:hypothetical protein
VQLVEMAVTTSILIVVFFLKRRPFFRRGMAIFLAGGMFSFGRFFLEYLMYYVPEDRTYLGIFTFWQCASILVFATCVATLIYLYKTQPADPLPKRGEPLPDPPRRRSPPQKRNAKRNRKFRKNHSLKNKPFRKKNTPKAGSPPRKNTKRKSKATPPKEGRSLGGVLLTIAAFVRRVRLRVGVFFFGGVAAADVALALVFVQHGAHPVIQVTVDPAQPPRHVHVHGGFAHGKELRRLAHGRARLRNITAKLLRPFLNQKTHCHLSSLQSMRERQKSFRIIEARHSDKLPHQTGQARCLF